MAANLKATFDLGHVYSAAPEAGKKRAIDEAIIGGDYLKGIGLVRMDSADYLKALIERASHGGVTVKPAARGMQFFIVKGGAEGFLDEWYRGRDASRVTISDGTTTSGKPGTIMVFDNNDLIAAFSSTGQLVGSALLERPLSITNPNIWTERTANRVYNAWDGRPVTLYHNKNFDIAYYGLMVDDSLGMYSSGRVRIDIHKQEASNGCIFLVDANTPPYSDPSKLNHFEPAFIKAIQTHIKAMRKYNIGTMHMVEIK